MLAYDAWLGLRYWDSLSRGTAAQTEASALLVSARGASGIAAVFDQQLARDEALLESQSMRFSYAHPDELIELLATTARASGVALSSITVAEAGTQATGPLSYRVFALAIRVSGATQPIYAFIGALSPAHLENGWHALSFGQSNGPMAALVTSFGITWLVAAEGDHMMLGQGGVPIMRDGLVIGACGVGGGTAQEDEACARAGIDLR